MNDTNDKFVELLNIRMQLGLDTTAATLSNLRNSAAATTYDIVRDELFRPVGYIAWASINKEAFANIIAHGALPKYPYEWNEGRLIFITEMLVGHGSKFALRARMAELFRNRRIVVFVRKGVVSIYSRNKFHFRLVYKKRQMEASG